MMSFVIEETEKKLLLTIARNSITTYLKDDKQSLIEVDKIPDRLKEKNGVFVSLYYEQALRGCIGRLETNQALYITVHDMAVAAAFHDRRFSSLSLHEIEDTHIEISVLSPLRKISDISKIIPGKHGIYLKKDYSSGTYLPQVAIKTGWNTEEMLSHCAHDKAGLEWHDWKTADIYIYEAIIVSDKN